MQSGVNVANKAVEHLKVFRKTLEEQVRSYEANLLECEETKARIQKAMHDTLDEIEDVDAVLNRMGATNVPG